MYFDIILYNFFHGMCHDHVIHGCYLFYTHHHQGLQAWLALITRCIQCNLVTYFIYI